MRKLLLTTTALLVANLATLPPASADFGSWLEAVPFRSAPKAAATAPAETPKKAASTLVAQPPLPAENATPRPLDAPDAAAPATKAAMPNPETLLDTLDEPSLNRVEPTERQLAPPPPAPSGAARSPVPPPHTPDESDGMKSEWSARPGALSEQSIGGMIEADVERAAPGAALPNPVVMDPPSAVGSGRAGEATASAGSTCGCQKPHGHAGHPSHHRAAHHHRHVPQARPAPVPYVYSGPGLPPPASLESHYRTPECYRGVWDGYALEKARRCRLCHEHLHDRCNCHQDACGVTAPCSGEPCGHCARVPFSSASGY